jgi:hypothetical protein
MAYQHMLLEDDAGVSTAARMAGRTAHHLRLLLEVSPSLLPPPPPQTSSCHPSLLPARAHTSAVVRRILLLVQ